MKNMRKGYKIFHDEITHKNGVLIVSNYNPDNEVRHWNFDSKKSTSISKSDIGMWKIKKLKHE